MHFKQAVHVIGLLIALTASVLVRAQAPAAGPGPYQKRAAADAAAVGRGKGIYSVNCAFCHGADTLFGFALN